MSAFDELVDARLLTSDTGSDLLNLTGIRFSRPHRIGEQRTPEHDHVAHLISDRLLRKVGVTELAHGDDGNGKPFVRYDAILGEVILDELGNFQENTGLHRCRRMWEPPVVVASEIDIEHVDAGLNEILHIVKRLFNRSLIAEFLERLYCLHTFAVRRVERQRQVDPVHDGVIRSRPFAYLSHDIESECLPIGVSTPFSAIERRVAHLFQEVSFVAVEIHTVDGRRFRVGCSLTEVFDDFFELSSGNP